MTRPERESIAELPEVAKAFARAYQCPDCDADSELRNLAGAAVLEVRHDDTCPRLARVTR